jgi:acid phosphatase type 7
LASKLEPILLEGGVTAVFNGHDHNYQHHLKSGLHHIVTGGGGAPLYDVDPIPDITLKAVKTENYVRVRIKDSKAEIEAVDLDGNMIESFELSPRTKTLAPIQ